MIFSSRETKVGQSSKVASGSVSSFPTSVWNKPRVFQERTNSLDGPSYDAGRSETALMMTVDLDLAGIPAPSHSSLFKATHSSPSIRRHHRYSLAEEDLTVKFRRCNAEASPRELQIRALRKATTMLSAHAQDSRARANELRALLADRGMDPSKYERLKQERWMAEKRQRVAELDAKAVLKELDNLLSDKDRDIAVLVPMEPPPEKRRCVNLATFLRPSVRPSPVRVSKVPLVFSERTLRRRTLSKVSSMRLRATHTKDTRLGSVEGRAGSRSVDSEMGPVSNHMRSAHNSPSFPPIVEGVNPDADASSLSERSFSSPPSSCTSTILNSPPTPTQTCTFALPPTHHPSGLESQTPMSENGIVTIFRPRSPEFSINSEDIEVQIPEYALNLMSSFSLEYETPLPSLPSLPPSSKPTTSKPPSHRSSFLSFTPTPRERKQANRISIPTLPSFSSPFSSPRKLAKIDSGPLHKSTSHRHLGGLFAIAEAQLGEKSALSRTRVDHEEGEASASTSMVSLPKLAIAEEEKDDLSTRVKKRLSALRLGRV